MKKNKDIKFSDSAPKHAKKVTRKSVVSKKQGIGLGILCGITGLLEIAFVVMISMINMLPGALVALIAFAMVLLLAIILFLMFSKSKNVFGKRKIAATVLASITIIGCIIGIYILSTIFGAFGDVFKGKTISKEELDDPFIVYISGSDTRNNELDENSRSDVNILAVVNPTTHQVLLINTPRDYYVPNPALNNGMDKLTHCGVYGIDNSIKALETLYDIKEINYYGRINFTGFTTLIDSIGGIDVYSDYAFTTESSSNVRISQGENHLNGTEALAFARERQALANGDFGRGENQMKVIKAVLSKVTSSDTLIKNYSSVMKSLSGMFETDVPQLLMTNMVKEQLSNSTDWNIQSYAVTGTCDWGICASSGENLSVVYQNKEMVNTAKDLIQKVLDGETIDTSTLAQ